MVLCTSGISTWYDCPYTPQYALCMRSICQYSSSSSSKLAYRGLQAIAMYSIYLQNFFFTKYLLYIFISSVYILYSLCSMRNSATASYVSCISDIVCMTWIFFLTLRPDQSLFCVHMLKAFTGKGGWSSRNIVTWSWYDLPCSHITCSNEMRRIKNDTPQQPHSGLESLLHRMTLCPEGMMSGYTSSMMRIFHFFFIFAWGTYPVYNLWADL